jgi:hypothetical protein
LLGEEQSSPSVILDRVTPGQEALRVEDALLRTVVETDRPAFQHPATLHITPFGHESKLEDGGDVDGAEELET